MLSLLKYLLFPVVEVMNVARFRNVVFQGFASGGLRGGEQLHFPAFNPLRLYRFCQRGLCSL